MAKQRSPTPTGMPMRSPRLCVPVRIALAAVARFVPDGVRRQTSIRAGLFHPIAAHHAANVVWRVDLRHSGTRKEVLMNRRTNRLTTAMIVSSGLALGFVALPGLP